jgi:integrase
MASVVSDPNSLKRVMFFDCNGDRKTVRLGKLDKRKAEDIRGHIEHIMGAKRTGGAIPSATAIWLREIDDTLADRLASAGLIDPRNSQRLGVFLDTFVSARETSAKPNTIRNMNGAKKALLEFFGVDCPIRSITPANAEAFRQKAIDLKLGENTVRRRCGLARQFFNAAIRQKMIQENPFREIKCTVRATPERFFYITREMALKVLDACPNLQWKLIFALCRFGGLRCPSELMLLRWGDIDWENGRVRIHSPKTEHHDGGESRIIPLFEELRPLLLEALEQAPEGSEHIIWQYRMENGNLRTGLERIIWHAGLKPWPKLFNNLRSSRETELAETFPLHVVCAWIGNSKAVAAEHYLQVTSEHFQRALGSKCAKAAHSEGQAAQKAAQRSSEDCGGSRKSEGVESTVNAELVGACSDSQADSQMCTTGQDARGGGRTRTPCGTGS